MKRLFLILVFYLFSQISSFSNERDVRLNQLFNELKANKSKVSSIVEQEIWKIWSTHPTDAKLTARLEQGSQFVRNQQLSKAIEIFTEVIDLDQNWAEAWNKRATVFYMLGEYDKSMTDINTTLKLEPRHFGAMDGMILIFLQKGKVDQAVKIYDEIIKIFPKSKSTLKAKQKLLNYNNNSA